MGVVDTIRHDRFPVQGRQLHAPVGVYFAYDTDRMIDGVVVRDDAERPHELIIRLANGRYVRGSECQYSLKSLKPSDRITEEDWDPCITVGECQDIYNRYSLDCFLHTKETARLCQVILSLERRIQNAKRSLGISTRALDGKL